MTEEIKEILKKTNIDAVSYGVIINYITNLQKENENLLYEINGYLEEKERLKEKINKLEDYKQRNEKAIEKIVIKQARLINEKDYIITDLDLDEIMQTLESGE